MFRTLQLCNKTDKLSKKIYSKFKLHYGTKKYRTEEVKKKKKFFLENLSREVIQS